MALRPDGEVDDELAWRGSFLFRFFGALTLILCFFLQGFSLAQWVGNVPCRRDCCLRSVDGEEHNNWGNDAGGGVGRAETNCPKFCDIDRYWLQSLNGEEDKNSGTDVGGGAGLAETNCRPKFSDNDVPDCGEGTAMNGCAPQLDEREDG